MKLPFKLPAAKFTLILMTALIGYAAVSVAADRIDITPRRIIIEPRERSGEMTLLNLSNEEGTFRVAIINYRQDETGTYSILQGPLNPAFDPEQVLRLSPRQFTLPPQGRQKIRFTIRKPADLPDGEYRFHLLATRMSDYGPPTPISPGEKSVGVTANISTAIPVVVRHGEVSVGATLTDASYNPGNAEGHPEVKVTINRSGNISTIGTIRVYSNAGGQEKEIGLIGNTNIFTEVNKRFVKIVLREPASPGSMRIVYTNDKTQEIYAETRL